MWSVTTRVLNEALCRAWEILETSGLTPEAVTQALPILQGTRSLRNSITFAPGMGGTMHTSDIRIVLTVFEQQVLREVIEAALLQAGRSRYRHLTKVLQQLPFRIPDERDQLDPDLSNEPKL